MDLLIFEQVVFQFFKTMSCSDKEVAGWEVDKDEGVTGRFEYTSESPGPAICQKMAACAPDHSTNPPLT